MIMIQEDFSEKFAVEEDRSLPLEHNKNQMCLRPISVKFEKTRISVKSPCYSPWFFAIWEDFSKRPQFCEKHVIAMKQLWFQTNSCSTFIIIIRRTTIDS